MNNSLINQSFERAKRENRPALLTYTVAGDNTKKKSLEILRSISKYADICELGFPHNTPIADGGQIQTSAYRAIKNGIKINDVFSIVSKFKKLRKDKPKKKIYFTLARTKKSFLLFKKNEKSFWESLWVPYNSDHHEKNILFKEPDKREVTTIRHLLSHLELEITIEIFNYKTPFKIKSNLEHQWINKDQIHKYGLPKPIKTIIDNHVC